MRSIDKYIGVYPMSKTLRFELRPQAETQSHIHELGLIGQDSNRAENYKKLKILLDSLHQDFIANSLKSVNIDWVDLSDSINDYLAEDSDENKAALESMKSSKRDEVGQLFTSNKDYKLLFNNEILKILMPNWIDDSDIEDKEEMRSLLKSFDRFGAYFTGYHENRKNVYSPEEISTSIPYRVVNDNFARFLSNIKSFAKLEENYPEIKAELTEEIGEVDFASFLDVNSYNRSISQDGIDSYNRMIVGEAAEKNVIKKKGINELVSDARKADKSKPNIKFAPLFKQIMSDRKRAFKIDSYKADKDMVDDIRHFHSQVLSQEINGSNVNILELIKRHFAAIDNYDKRTISISRQMLFDMSRTLYEDNGIVFGKLSDYAIGKFGSATKAGKAKADKWSKSKYFKLSDAEAILSVGLGKKSFNDYYELAIIPAIRQYTLDYSAFDSRFGDDYFVSNKIKDSDADKSITASVLTSARKLQDIISWFFDKDEVERDTNFYIELEPCYDIFKQVNSIVNKCHSYLSQKHDKSNKFKLNFNFGSLAGGWDANKEQTNGCVILRRDGKYYLGVMNSKDKPNFAKIEGSDGDDCYEKMIYKLLPGPNKMLPKVFFSRSGIATFSPSDYILDNYKIGKHKKGAMFDLQYCHDLIDWFKSAIERHKDWSKFGFNFSATDTYADISGFYQEITEQGFMLNYQKIDKSIVDKFVENGSLFLFEIYCKDFSEKSTGTKNLHTLLWESIFIPNSTIRMSGEAELFYRKAEVRKPFAHNRGEILINKHDVDGFTIPHDVFTELFKHYNSNERTALSDWADEYKGRVVIKNANHAITKDRRFASEKYQFHVPIAINYKQKSAGKFNANVRETLSEDIGINAIGISMPSDHLICYTVINNSGEAIDEGNFDVVNGTNYYEKITMINEFVKTANKIEHKTSVSDLTEGYYSQVVSEVAKLMVRHNAILVMPDYNFKFAEKDNLLMKKKYKDLVLSIVQKLNYYVDKRTGEATSGYQLTPPTPSLSQVGKQLGWVLTLPLLHYEYEDISPSRLMAIKGMCVIETKYRSGSSDTFVHSDDFNNYLSAHKGSI